jgi:chromosomal replication initiation ATPase DnaA
LQKNLQELWQNIIDKAVPQLPERSAELWFTTCTPVAIENGELVVDVANIFAKEQLASRFMNELNKAAKSTGEVSGIRLSAKEESGEEKKTEDRKSVV